MFSASAEDMDLLDTAFDDYVVPAGPSQRQFDARILRAIRDGRECCFCRQSLYGANPDKVTLKHGVNNPAHSECSAADKALERVLSQLPPGTQEHVKDLRRTDPEAYTKILSPLVTAGAPRTQQQRNKAKAFITEVFSESKVARRQRMLMLTYRQYKAYMKYSEGMEDHEIDGAYRAALQDNAVRKEQAADGTVLVGVRGYTVLEKTDSAGKRRKLQGNDEIGSDAALRDATGSMQELFPDMSVVGEFGAPAAALAGPVPAPVLDGASALGFAPLPLVAAGGGSSQTQTASSLQNAVAQQLQQLSPAKQPLDSGSQAAAAVPAAAVQTRNIPEASVAPSPGPKAAPPTPTVDDDDNEEGKNKKTDADDEGPELPEIPEDLNRQNFGQWKKDVKATIRETLKTLQGVPCKGKRLPAHMKSLHSRLPAELCDGFDLNTIADNLNSAADALECFYDRKITLWKLDQFQKERQDAAVYKELQCAMESFHVKFQEAKESLDAVSERHAKVKKNETVEKRKRQYTMDKTKGIFLKGGYPELLARVFTRLCQQSSSEALPNMVTRDAQSAKDDEPNIVTGLHEHADSHTRFLHAFRKENEAKLLSDSMAIEKNDSELSDEAIVQLQVLRAHGERGLV